ncbi:undecaprenyl-phosphate glucose phosphotransferase [Romboutsia timonensis]|uniref:undecaprenyl-phosphate glucose phosphotransferase n=1 Tax=Romboutsia timonensis TaxID=1776391 RepID=UPI002A7EC9B5|nr:undecaprenyl-phosphate glucose phosphotransferase [Romboutsia timonensis]
MIRENQKFLNNIQIIVDMAIIVVSFLLAYYIRFYILNGYKSMSFSDLFIPILISIPMYLLLYTIFDLYTAKRTKSIYKEIFDIVKVNFVAALILILGLYVFKIVNFSRVTLALFVILNTTITSINRLCLRYTLRKYRKKGLNQKHCLIIGATNTSKELINRINKNKHWGYNVVGIIDNHKNKDGYFEDFKVIGNFEDVEYVLDNRHIDIVFITISAEEYIHIGSLLKACERAGVKTNIIPYYHKYVPAKPRMDDLDGLTMVDTRYVPLDSYIMAFSKRIFDIVFSLFAIILVSPIMLLSVIMIKLTSPGPVIYKQERVGLNRKKFYMYKFRSMKVQTEEEEKTKWSTKNDPRKTKWGSFMRKTSIDELPQFFNVLKGDMSIIGPRPERPYFVEKFRDEIPRYMIKHQVRPGITGWAQVSGFRGDTSIEGRIEHDLEYIENWTFFFDIKIVFLTIFKGFINKNAY